MLVNIYSKFFHGPSTDAAFESDLRLIAKDLSHYYATKTCQPTYSQHLNKKVTERQDGRLLKIKKKIAKQIIFFGIDRRFAGLCLAA